MDNVIARLEAVASRLESYEQNAQTGSRAASPGAKPALSPAPADVAPAVKSAPAPAAAQTAPATAAGLLPACDALESDQISALASSTAALPAEFRDSSDNFASGLRAMVDIVRQSQQRGFPSQDEWPTVAKGLLESMQRAEHLAGGPRTAAVNHNKAVSECMHGLAWVTIDGAQAGSPEPALMVAEALASADMYLYRVLQEFRQSAPEHKAWVAAVKACMQGTQGLAKAHCPSGLKWGPVGGASAPKETPKAAPSKPAGKGPPPPPPPPKPGAFFEKKPAAASAGGAAGEADLMASLNRGADVTSGLRKVTADMKTKNRADRTGAVRASDIKPAGSLQKAAPSRGPPSKVLKQNRWEVENYVGGEPVVLGEGDVKRDQTLYVAHCSDTVIQVNGKLNSIMLDNCKKVGVVFESLVACFEAVNCSGLQVQCTTSCPSLNVDKTDGAQIFLPHATAQATEITTAKASAVNVTVLPAEGDEADPVEHPVPEQFVSKFVEGKLVTGPVAHG